METLTKTTLLDIEFLIVENDQSANYSSEIIDLVMDSYNQHVKLGDAFRDEMQQLINSMEFAYPNDPQKLRQFIDQFVALSQESLVEYMKKMMALHIPHSHVVAVDVKREPNRNWMKDMGDQLSILKGPGFVQKSTEEEEFCYYEIVS